MTAILIKELRSMLREKRGFLVPMAYAAVLSAAVFLFLLASREGNSNPQEAGIVIGGIVAVVQSVALVIFAPLVGAAGIAGERERGTWLPLIASPATRASIALGKLAASSCYVLLLLSVSLPIGGLSVLYGGMDLSTLIGLYLTHAVLGVTLVSVGLAVSTALQRTWSAAMISIALAFGLGVFTLALFFGLGGAEHSSSRWLRAILYFNPGYSLFLFFAGDFAPGAQADWLWHYLAMAVIGASAAGLLVARLRRTRE